MTSSQLSHALTTLPPVTKWMVLLFRHGADCMIAHMRTPHLCACVCMFGCRSGYFAGGVFTQSSVTSSKGSRDVLTPIVHKVLHRYTTRRKQGGSQATHDAEGAC